MKAPETRKKRRTTNPFGRLDLRIEVSQEEILADLQYPASRRNQWRRGGTPRRPAGPDATRAR